MKNWLIKKLGGYPAREVQILLDAKLPNGKQYNQGKQDILVHLEDFADKLYGKSADAWCKAMYNEIITLLNN